MKLSTCYMSKSDKQPCCSPLLTNLIKRLTASLYSYLCTFVFCVFFQRRWSAGHLRQRKDPFERNLCGLINEKDNNYYENSPYISFLYLSTHYGTEVDEGMCTIAGVKLTQNRINRPWNCRRFSASEAILQTERGPNEQQNGAALSPRSRAAHWWKESNI